ncbi:Memo-like protein, putative [Leishmania lindenbergi]|uniref:Memo-like protein n=1 Tax=Leishmania lindenbergi TaxID=651832 RepID=A0AAW2ZQR6_9TRYP
MHFVRSATHAAPHGCGWYEAIPERLKATIDDYLREVTHHYEDESRGGARMMGLIVPHAGMSYSGRTACEAFAVFREYLYAKGSKGSKVERIFILGPSHTKGFEGCELSAASAYETPFGPLKVDTATVDRVITALCKAGVGAATASRRTDEAEHSIEMETPYLSHILHYPPAATGTSTQPAAARVSIVPIIVGWTNRQDEKAICDALKPYMDDARNFFIFSSDFCHWGDRFSYTYHYQRYQYPNIGDSIIAMDHAAMELLERRDLEGWYGYLRTTKNTICGRAPISIGMQHWMDEASKVQIKFVHYSQSNKCLSVEDSSVSYAAAIILA